MEFYLPGHYKYKSCVKTVMPTETGVDVVLVTPVEYENRFSSEKPLCLHYSDGEPNTVVEDFNLEVTDYERFNDAWLMGFEETQDDEICTRLFGAPSDWNYEDEPPKLLMQYDPLDNDMDFLDYLDGFLYFFFGEDEKDLRSVYLKEEYT